MTVYTLVDNIYTSTKIHKQKAIIQTGWTGSFLLLHGFPAFRAYPFGFGIQVSLRHEVWNHKMLHSSLSHAIITSNSYFLQKHQRAGLLVPECWSRWAITIWQQSGWLGVPLIQQLWKDSQLKTFSGFIYGRGYKGSVRIYSLHYQLIFLPHYKVTIFGTTELDLCLNLALICMCSVQGELSIGVFQIKPWFSWSFDKWFIFAHEGALDL